MRVGFHLPTFEVDGSPAGLRARLAATGAAVEAAGASWLSVMDHFFQIEGTGLPADSNMLEGYTTLGFLAAHTETVDLGLLVTGVTYRHPGILAKTIATLDVLSGGRAVLGIGAAWFEREHQALGVPFPGLAERFERLEEAIQICQQMWNAGECGPYQGKHYQLAETLCVPSPLHKPPILIGGGGERKTLRLVATYADACNLFASSTDEVAHKLSVLRNHCDKVGRDVDDIAVTVITNDPLRSARSRDDFVTQMARYADTGVHMVILTPPADSSPAWIEDTAPVVTRLAQLG